MARSAEDSELAPADEAVGRLGEWYHLRGGIGVSRLASLTFSVEGKRLEIFGGIPTIGSSSLLIGVDGGDPQSRGLIVIHRRG